MFFYKQVLLPLLETAALNFQDDRRTDEHMVRCDLVPFLRAEKANVPTLGHRFLVKFPWVGKAIEVKCPTFARGPPLGLNIDRCIRMWVKIFLRHTFTLNLLEYPLSHLPLPRDITITFENGNVRTCVCSSKVVLLHVYFHSVFSLCVRRPKTSSGETLS